MVLEGVYTMCVNIESKVFMMRNRCRIYIRNSWEDMCYKWVDWLVIR